MCITPPPLHSSTVLVVSQIVHHWFVRCCKPAQLHSQLIVLSTLAGGAVFVLLSSAKSSSPYVTQMSMALFARTYTVLIVRLRLRQRQWTSSYAHAPFFPLRLLLPSIMYQVRSGAELLFARPTYGSVIQSACTCLLHLTFVSTLPSTFSQPTTYLSQSCAMMVPHARFTQRRH